METVYRHQHSHCAHWVPGVLTRTLRSYMVTNAITTATVLTEYQLCWPEHSDHTWWLMPSPQPLCSLSTSCVDQNTQIIHGDQCHHHSHCAHWVPAVLTRALRSYMVTNAITTVTVLTEYQLCWPEHSDYTWWPMPSPQPLCSLSSSCVDQNTHIIHGDQCHHHYRFTKGA